MVDKVMYGIDAGKLTLIVTDKPQTVAQKINDIAGRGTTFLKAKGGFTEEDKSVVMCACDNKQMYPIQNAVKEADPKAFIIILDPTKSWAKVLKTKNRRRR